MKNNFEKKKESINVFVHTHLAEFVSKFLSFDDFENHLAIGNRCKCPFHRSHDNDFSYNGRYGYWKCFGKCSCTYGDSFSLILKLYFPNTDYSNKDESRRALGKAIKLFDEWIDGRVESKVVTFQNEVQVVSEDRKMETIFQIMSKKFSEKNSIYTPEYIRCNFRKWFCPAQTDRFLEKTKKEMRIFETSKNLPKELYYLSYYFYYMMYDENERLVGFQGRRKDDNNKISNGIEIHKMYNLSGFDKSNMIYNLYNCKSSKVVCIVEGPGDVCRAYELLGQHCFISLMGGELSPYQLYLLKKTFAPNTSIVLFLDNDGPGKKYSRKVAKKLLEAGFTNVKMTHVFSTKDVGGLVGKKGAQELALCAMNSLSVTLSENGKIEFEKNSEKHGVSTFSFLLNKRRKLRDAIKRLKD